MTPLLMTTFVGALLPLFGMGPTPFGFDDAPEVPQLDKQAAELGRVNLYNAGRLQRTGTAVVEEPTDGRTSLSWNRLAAYGRNKIFVGPVGSSRRGNGVPLGIIVDDGVPF